MKTPTFEGNGRERQGTGDGEQRGKSTARQVGGYIKHQLIILKYTTASCCLLAFLKCTLGPLRTHYLASILRSSCPAPLKTHPGALGLRNLASTPAPLKTHPGALRPRNLASIPAPLKPHPGALRPCNLLSIPAPLKMHPRALRVHQP